MPCFKLTFILFLLAIPLTEASFCPQEYAKLAFKDASKYWKNEMAPFIDLFRSGATEAEVSQAMADRMPSPLQKIFHKSMRCAEVGMCLVEHGVKTGYAPVFLLADTAVIPPATVFNAVRNLSKTGPDKAMQKILLVPSRIVYKNAPYVAGYTALTATGYNIPMIIEDKTVTYIHEIDEAVPMEPFKQDELLVIVNPLGDKDLGEKVGQYFSQRRKDGVNLKDQQIVEITVSSAEDLFKKLGELRSRGRIKEVVMVGHGSSGNMYFKSGGIADLTSPGKMFDSEGKFNEESLHQMKPITDSWPKDLFAEKARINLISCSVAYGKNGERFIKNIAGVMLQNEGTLVASPRTLKASPNIKRGWIEEETKFQSNNATSALLYHFLYVPFRFMTDGTALTELGTDPVKVIHVGREN